MSTTTIAAIATPPGGGPRGVIRVSGPAAADVVGDGQPGVEGERLRAALAGPRGLHEARFFDGRGSLPLLLLWMPGPRSYTREDVAELHLPGAPALLARALERLLAAGAEPAAPGEFTRRAFLNGRLDLSRAEGVLETIAAGSEAERRSAAALLGGGLERRVGGLRERLEDLRALCEASLDFDEADTGHVPVEELRARADAAAEALDGALAWEVHRPAPSALPRVVLAGAPNAGKSSLFNALTGGEALVSEVSGSTRDALEGLWDLGGLECLLFDTAGLDPGARGADAVAQEHGARARAAADLELRVLDASDPRAAEPDPGGAPARRLVVHNKVDLLPGGAGSAEAGRAGGPDGGPERAGPDCDGPDCGGEGPIAVSARRGDGLEVLASRVAALLGGGPGEAPGGGVRELSLRHRRALRSARRALRRGRAGLAAGAPLDAVAETLREATDALDGITGRTSPEDLLDRIFARFCIGK